MRAISTVEELESVVGRRALPALLKSIPELDGHCRTFADLSSFGFLTFVDPEGRDRTVTVGGTSGFAAVTSPTTVELPLPEDLGALPASSSAALLLLIPDLRETLRINGRLTAPEPGKAVLTVEDAFLHCAKCVIRSRLWDPPTAEPPAPSSHDGDGPLADPDVLGFLSRSPFVVIGSRDASGAADISPKGDPPGFVRVLDAHTVAVPDRPGNRRTDTFHNILERPEVSLLAIVPGESQALELRGSATVTDDQTLLSSMQVQGRTPRAALLVKVDHAALALQRPLADAAPWDPERPPTDLTRLNLKRAWVDHVKQNKHGGDKAARIRESVNESAIDAGIRRDYENNLY